MADPDPPGPVPVRIWSLRPDPELARLLSPAELARARRFAHPADRARSITGAALLRAYAAAVQGRAPERAEVRRRCTGCGGTDHGRPEIAGTQVSLSHSGDRVLLAAAGVRVGIDVECAPVGGELSAQLLAPGEPATDLARRWVRKEAVAKLTGHGLLRPLSGIRLVEHPTGWSAEVDGQAYAGRDLPLPEPAAVAVEGHACEPRWSGEAETRDRLLRTATGR